MNQTNRKTKKAVHKKRGQLREVETDVHQLVVTEVTRRKCWM
ncbi:hypothetical protein [Ralstonia holmesii]